MTSTTSSAAVWMKEVMADAAWIRRLAGALVGDPEAALDAVQETWVKTGGRVDAPTRPRGWLRAVLGNSLRAQRRAQRRRQAREEATTTGAPDAPTPEELLGRLEVQRTVAALVESLAEPARQVILLHYYEGMTLAAIAASTGTPAGTVRWRLKTALEELRERLQKRYARQHGDWRLALVPLAEARPADPSGAAALATPMAGALRGRWALLGAGLASITLVAGARLLGCGAGAPTSTSLARRAAAAAPSAPRPAARNPRGPKLSAAALAADCPEDITRLEDARARAGAALAYYLPPQTLWSDAGPDARNEVATRTVTPVVDRWLDQLGAPRQGRSFECRGDSCVGTVVQPYPPQPPWIHKKASADVEQALRAHARSFALEGPAQKQGPQGAPLAETQLSVRLNAASGAAQPPGPPPVFPPQLLPSASLARTAAGAPSPAMPRTEPCRERTAAAASALEKLRWQALRQVPAAVLYQNERPNPALTQRISATLAAVLARNPELDNAERATPLTADCRGLVCQVVIPATVVVREHLIKTVLNDGAITAQAGRLDVHTRNGKVDVPPYFSILPGPDETTEGELILRHVARRVMKGNSGIEGCSRRFTAEGVIKAHLVLPADGEVNEDGVARRISVRLSGPLAEAPVGRCIFEAITATTAALTLPEGVSGAQVNPSIKLP
jgi:RNA polymerase sigma-70 factor (ECF subfamily)